VFAIQREASIAGFGHIFPPAAAVRTLRAQGAGVASLWCLAENGRARRFYEKNDWRLNGRERIVPFPPHPSA